MDPERWRRLQGIFEEAIALPPGERTAYIERACSADANLSAEVGRLVAAHGRAEGILDHGRPDGILETAGGEPSGAPPESEIGGFRILRVLGSGGTGVVHEAWQRDPPRKVAIKVLNRGLTSASTLKRFELEGRILATLQHPGIAQVYATGVHRDAAGEFSYLAMELIDGEPITRFAERRGLGVRERVSLLIEVSEAVEHAHRRGVIHRDLKPANILVDSAGRPRVLDFGIARATDADLRPTTGATETGQLLGTLPYMSPEQAAGDPSRIDARTDVYALGVLLYELMTSRLPHEPRGRSVTELLRAIGAEDPEPLGSIDRALRGDVAAIAAKALEKDPARRYASARELADDLRRYLANEPILATPPTALYQLRKFAARNRILVAGAAAVFLVLVLGIISTTYQAVRARQSEKRALELALSEEREKDAAVAARDQAEEVSRFLKGLFGSVARVRKGPDVKVVEMLDGWASEIDRSFAGRPELAAELHNTLGAAYYNLGLYEKARREIEPALKAARDALGEDHPQAVHLLDSRAMLLKAEGRFGEAEALERRVIDAFVKLHGQGSWRTLAARDNLGAILLHGGKKVEAEAVLRDAVAAARRALPGHHETGIRLIASLGRLLLGKGELPEAEKLLREAAEGLRCLRGPAHPETLLIERELAGLLGHAGRLPEAEEVLRRILETTQAEGGEGGEVALESRLALSGLCERKGAILEAERLSRETLDLARERLGEGSALAHQTVARLALLLTRQGRSAAALSLLEEDNDRLERRYGEEAPETLRSLSALADALVEAGRLAEGRDLFVKALETEERTLGEGHPQTLETRNLYGVCLQRAGDYDRAAEVFRRQLIHLDGPAAREDEGLFQALYNLSFVLLKGGKVEDVRPLLDRAAAVSLRVFPAGHSMQREVLRLKDECASR